MSNEPLECLRCVLEPERHAEELEQAEGSDDRHLGYVGLVHGHLMVPADEVHLAEHPEAMEVG